MKYLLLPFSLLYGIAVAIRNKLYDKGILKSYSFDLPVIGIGNLSTGGTGKTPMAEHTLQLLLAMGRRPALLSRGYGRQTSGYILGNELSNAGQIGDEPYQVLKKFPQVTVAVCENRVAGIQRLLIDRPDTDVIVLDDCFQHRRLRAGFYILLTDFNTPYYNDHLLPAGRLRESRAGRRRADMIIMTKCPDISSALPRERLKNQLRPKEGQEVYFTGLKYSEPTAITHEPIKNIKGYGAISFSGIANPKPFSGYIQSNFIPSAHLSWPDHHNFKKKDIEKIISEYNALAANPKLIITTEKDWRRIENTPAAGLLSGLPAYYLPVEILWNADEKRSFDLKINDYVSKYKRNGRIHQSQDKL